MEISNTPPNKDKRTRAYKEWKKAFDKQNSIGLGDLVERFTEETGIKRAVEFIAGEDCGCDKRKEKLNKIRFRYRPVRCFTENQYNRWADFRNKKGDLNNEDIILIHECFEQLFALTFKRLNCCYEQYIKEIDKVYEAY